METMRLGDVPNGTLIQAQREDHPFAVTLVTQFGYAKKGLRRVQRIGNPDKPEASLWDADAPVVVIDMRKMVEDMVALEIRGDLARRNLIALARTQRLRAITIPAEVVEGVSKSKITGYAETQDGIFLGFDHE